MRVSAHYHNAEGIEFTFDEVFYDSQGNVFLDEGKQLPIQFYLTDEHASFDRYEILDLPTLRSADAENLLYRMRALLRHPVRPAVLPVKPAEQDSRLHYEPKPGESRLQALQRTFAEAEAPYRAARERERQEIMSRPPSEQQQYYNRAAENARRAFFEQEKQRGKVRGV
jgi:hypothetical protein